jgi:hypothetical protein
VERREGSDIDSPDLRKNGGVRDECALPLYKLNMTIYENSNWWISGLFFQWSSF